LSRSYFRHRKVERAYLERAGRAPASPGITAPDLGDRDALWDALARLPQRQRAALVLRYYEDLSERQIADVLQAPVGTVKSLLSRGLNTLRNEIGGEER
jgi:RNA polymerase sigma factor (sigma-70 family)